LVWVVALLVVGVFSGCGQKSAEKEQRTQAIQKQGKPEQAQPAKGQKFLIGFSQCNFAEPWRQAMNQAAIQEAKNNPQIELVLSDAQQDDSKQIADVENFLRQKVDLLIISPNTAAPLTPIVKKVHDSGIPVICLDRDLLSPEYDVFIGANNFTIGEAAGKYVVELLNGQGRVVELMGLLGSPPAKDRSDGFHSVVDGVAGIEVIHKAEGKWLLSEARVRMEEILRAQPEIDLVYAHNDPMAVGAYKAAQDMGREKNIFFIGIDALGGEEGGVKKVMDGVLTSTFWYPTCGQEAVQVAWKILNGEEVEPRIELPTAQILKENAQEWFERLTPKTE